MWIYHACVLLRLISKTTIVYFPQKGDNSTTRDYIHQTLGAKDASYDSDARSIRSFSSGHQKGNSLTKVIRRLRGEGVNKDYWMADENAKECFGCSASFFMFRRKHHCRICGKRPLWLWIRADKGHLSVQIPQSTDELPNMLIIRPYFLLNVRGQDYTRSQAWIRGQLKSVQLLPGHHAAVRAA